MPFALFNHSSLSYIFLALSSAVTKLSNKTLIFHHFQGPTIKFHNFTGLENEILKLHDFPGFPCMACMNPDVLCNVKERKKFTQLLQNEILMFWTTVHCLF